MYYFIHRNRKFISSKAMAEVVYKDGDLSVAAEISHNAEKEANLAGGNRRSVWILVDLDVILWYD